MTSKHKEDIIEILEQWKGMLGTDTERTQQLINQMNKFVFGEEPNQSKVDDVYAFYDGIMGEIGYDSSCFEKRNLQYSSIRYAMYYLAIKKFGLNTSVDYATYTYFGKNRTTMNHWKKSIESLQETNDVYFNNALKKIAYATVR